MCKEKIVYKKTAWKREREREREKERVIEWEREKDNERVSNVMGE